MNFSNSMSIYVRRMFSTPNLSLLLATLLLLITPFVKPISINRSVYSFQIGFDISQSMNVQDMELDGTAATRLKFAKDVASQFLQSLPCGSAVGWSVFTGRRTLTLLTPLEVCAHYSGLLSSLDEISGNMRWSNGSSIGKGVHQIMRAANEFDEPTAIIFITDGQEAPPLEQGQRGVPNTDKFDVNGLLVGVGGDTPKPIPKTDTKGNNIGVWSASDVVQRVPSAFSGVGEEFSKRDTERLQALARLTKLRYITLDSLNALSRGANDKQFAKNRPTLTDLRWLPASLALLLLVLRFGPDFRRRGSLRTQ